MLRKYENVNTRTKEEIKSAFVHWKHDTTVSTFEEWAAKKAFHVRTDGKLDQRYNHCEPAFMADA